MDPIKEAFAKAKQDVAELREEISLIKQNLSEIKHLLSNQMQNPTQNVEQQTNKQENSTQILSEHSKLAQYSLKQAYTQDSIGNRGVPTNQQTNQQTNGLVQDSGINDQLAKEKQLSEVLASFDTVRTNLKNTFQSLTKQEMSVFSAVYMLEEQGKQVDYPSMAANLGLSEISIRDYILKMSRKGIPIIKTKHNNKKITLSIDPSLKKIASLSSLILLREPNNY